MNFRAQSSFSGLNASVVAATFNQAARLAVEQSAAIVLEEAEALCPVDSGTLRDSGHVEMLVSDGPLPEAAVVFDAPHAQFIEYGTGVRGEGTYPYELPEAGVPITGGWVYDYKSQNWQGHAAQPFARPALDLARPAIVEVFRDNAALAAKQLGRP